MNTTSDINARPAVPVALKVEPVDLETSQTNGANFA